MKHLTVNGEGGVMSESETAALIRQGKIRKDGETDQQAKERLIRDMMAKIAEAQKFLDEVKQRRNPH
jgi:hypothetical protein